MCKRKLIDIGANLIDNTFNGIYHGKSVHAYDLDKVLERSWSAGLKKIIITGTSYEDSKKAYELSLNDNRLYCTVGCHPTMCTEFENNPNGNYLEQFKQLYKDCNKKVVAFGEFGLDYDRLNFCNKELQKKYFQLQLTIAELLNVPVFLHCRAAHEELYEILASRRVRLPVGVVHSFDGQLVHAQNFINLGFYIGLNGCSLKTTENLDVVKSLPKQKILIESDSPWCDIRPSHAGFKYVKTKFETVKKEKWRATAMIKGRNEPANICQVLEVIAAVQEVDADELAGQIYNNTLKCFFPNEIN